MGGWKGALGIFLAFSANAQLAPKEKIAIDNMVQQCKVEKKEFAIAYVPVLDQSFDITKSSTFRTGMTDYALVMKLAEQGDVYHYHCHPPVDAQSITYLTNYLYQNEIKSKNFFKLVPYVWRAKKTAVILNGVPSEDDAVSSFLFSYYAARMQTHDIITRVIDTQYKDPIIIEYVLKPEYQEKLKAIASHHTKATAVGLIGLERHMESEIVALEMQKITTDYLCRYWDIGELQPKHCVRAAGKPSAETLLKLFSKDSRFTMKKIN